jgi:hypothetical protein
MVLAFAGSAYAAPWTSSLGVGPGGITRVGIPWFFQMWSHKTTTAEAFANSFELDRYIGEAELSANPSSVEGRIVGVSTKFRWFISQSDAIFGRTVTFVATGVPADFFRGEKDVVLALRVRGTRSVVIDGQQQTVPVGEYLGDWQCSEAGCADFWRQ